MSASNRPGAHHYHNGVPSAEASALRRENVELRARLAAVEARCAEAKAEYDFREFDDGDFWAGVKLQTELILAAARGEADRPAEACAEWSHAATRYIKICGNCGAPGADHG